MKPARKATSKTSVALGFRVHSGWAAVVAVAGLLRSPEVVDRRRIEIADPAIPGSKQPFHAAEGLPLKNAEALIGRCAASTRILARRAVRTLVLDLEKRGCAVIGAGILLASGKPVPALAVTLASHALIHTAEGVFFRNALIEASEHCNIPLTRVKERELFQCAASQLRVPAGELQRRVAEMGKLIGPPWRQDEKLAALVGCLVLAGAPSK